MPEWARSWAIPRASCRNHAAVLIQPNMIKLVNARAQQKGANMFYIGFDTYLFVNRESAARFRQELRINGLRSTLSNPSGGAYSYAVRVKGSLLHP